MAWWRSFISPITVCILSRMCIFLISMSEKVCEAAIKISIASNLNHTHYNECRISLVILTLTVKYTSANLAVARLSNQEAFGTMHVVARKLFFPETCIVLPSSLVTSHYFQLLDWIQICHWFTKVLFHPEECSARVYFALASYVREAWCDGIWEPLLSGFLAINTFVL